MSTRAWGGLALLIGLLWTNFGFAADWSVVPSINARTEYNSNLNLDFSQPLKDFIFTVSPVADFNYATEALNLQGRLGLTGLKYVTNTGYDHIDQNYQINGQYLPSARWRFFLTSSFIVDSTQQQELLTSGLVITRTPRQSFQVGPGFSYNLTEKLAASFNYGFYTVNYQDPQFQSYFSHSLAFSLSYPLNNLRTVLSGNVVGQETDYSSIDNTYRSLTMFLGADHRFSELWGANISAGLTVSFIDSVTQVTSSVTSSPQLNFITVPQSRLRATTLSPFVNASVTRRWTNLAITGGYGRTQSGSAFGSVSDMNHIFLNLSYSFTERLSGSLTGDYSLSNQLSQTNSFQNVVYTINSQLSYRITEKLSLSPGYRFVQNDDVSNSQSAHGHNVWVMLNYSYPIHYQK